MSEAPRLIAGGDAADPASAASAPGRAPKVLVWDLAVRVFHWTLVAAVPAAWLTGGSGSRFHELAGFAVASLFLFRMLWGIGGTRHARFRDFMASPTSLKNYLADILRNRARRHLGHNPAGGYMIAAMLLCILVIVATGILQMTSRFFGVAWVESLHHWAATALVWLIPLHVLGVVVSSWMHQENLVAAMIGGVKPARLPGYGEPVEVPSQHEQVMTRLHASQGFTLLAFMLAGGLYIGWTSTSHRTETNVAEAPATAAVTALAEAIQTSASARARDKQDYVAGGPEVVSQTWLISSGGRLYDNWFAALGLPGPASSHPAWPAGNTSSTGEQTWRCKNCHGWDYMGTSGIVGLQRMKGRDPAAITTILGNKTHGFGDELLPMHAKYRIALFVSRGQHVASQFVLPDGRIKGRAELGQPVFQSVCASCHGFDGRTRRLGASGRSGPPGYKGPPLFVGTKAVTGPVEVLHKIRNGHPGAIMVSMRPFPIDVAANILAYAQTLPVQ